METFINCADSFGNVFGHHDHHSLGRLIIGKAANYFGKGAFTRHRVGDTHYGTNWGGTVQYQFFIRVEAGIVYPGGHTFFG